MGSKPADETGLPLYGGDTLTYLWLLSVCSTCPRQQQMRTFRQITNSRYRVLASQGTGHNST